MVCDRGATKPDGLFRENPPGGGSFVCGLRWLGRHSPLRGCCGLAALAAAKIPRRRTPRNFQTGSQCILSKSRGKINLTPPMSARPAATYIRAVQPSKPSMPIVFFHIPPKSGAKPDTTAPKRFSTPTADARVSAGTISNDGWKDVSHEKPAAEAKCRGGDTCAVERGAVANCVEARRTEQQARGQNPEASGLRPKEKPVREQAAAQHADQGRALQESGGVESGVREAEGEFFMEKIRQPAVEQPESEDKHRKHDAEQRVSRHLHQGAKREAAPGLFRFDLSFFTHAAEKKKVRRSVEKTSGAEDEERLAPVAALGHPATKPAAADGAGDLCGGERGDSAGAVRRRVGVCGERDGRWHVERLGHTHRRSQPRSMKAEVEKPVATVTMLQAARLRTTSRRLENLSPICPAIGQPMP